MANKETTKTYVQYFYPGFLFSEDTSEVVSERNYFAICKNLPEGVFGFRFYDQVSKTTILDGETTQISGKMKNISGIYYPDGQLFSLIEIQLMGEDYNILASNMQGNNWNTVVKTRRGNFQPFTHGDSVVNTNDASRSDDFDIEERVV